MVSRVRSSAAGNALKAAYTWTADGQKRGVREAHTSSGGFEYLGSLIYHYVNGQLMLESGAFGGGRIKVSHGSATTYRPWYQLTDHLGSIRVEWDGRVPYDRNDYYPFGSRHIPLKKYAALSKTLKIRCFQGFFILQFMQFDAV